MSKEVIRQKLKDLLRRASSYLFFLARQLMPKGPELMFPSDGRNLDESDLRKDCEKELGCTLDLSTNKFVKLVGKVCFFRLLFSPSQICVDC